VDSTKILILLPIWKREAITELCFKNIKRLQKEYDIQVLTIVSEQWAKRLSFEYGFKYVESANSPLGLKMNTGLKEALRMDFDYLMNLGSDDILTKELFDMYQPYFKEKKEMFGCTRLTFLDSKSKGVKTYDYGIMMGAGRCIRKDILLKYSTVVRVKWLDTVAGLYYTGYKGETSYLRSDFVESERRLGRIEVLSEPVTKLYTDEKNSTLDNDSQARFFGVPMVEIKNDFNMVFDIKSDENIWDYDYFTGNEVSFEQGTKTLNDEQITEILEL
jgi:hypothetical protein